jgi:hypothetical protein
MPGWNEVGNIPEIFQGKTREEILKMIQDGEAARVKLAELEPKFSVLESQNTTLQTNLEKVTSTLSNLEVGFNELKTARSAGSSNNNEDEGKPKRPSILEDHEAWLQDRVNEKLRPIITATLMTQGNSALRDGMEQIRNNPDLRIAYDVLHDECEAMFKTLTVEQRLNASMYPTAVELVMGRNLKKLAAHINKEKGSLEVGSSAGGNANDGRGNAKIQLTQDQKEAAAKFGMSEEEYIAAATA